MISKSDLRIRCRKIIEKIKPSYPTLKNTKIHVHLWKQLQGSMMSLRFFGYRIFIDHKKWAGANDRELTGTLAHELVHLEHNKNTPYLKLLFEFFLYLTSTKFRRELERETDRITIRKGYGKELLKSSEFRIRMNKEYKKFIEKYYLSPEEIKSELKKLK